MEYMIFFLAYCLVITMFFYGARNAPLLDVARSSIVVGDVKTELPRVYHDPEALAVEYFLKFGKIENGGTSPKEEKPEAIPLEHLDGQEMEGNDQEGRDLSEDDDSEERIGNEEVF